MRMGLPLYSIIYSDIKQDILSGKLRPGDMIPKESALAKTYGSSKAPIRQAMGNLEMEGFIVRRQGKGTFVADKVKQSRLLLFSGFHAFYNRHLNEIGCKTLSVTPISPSAEIRQSLLLGEEQQAIHVHRVRLWSDTPIFSIHTYFSEKMGIEVFQKAGHYFSVAEVLYDNFNIPIAKAEERVTATLADEEESTALKVSIGTPLLQMDRISYDPSGTVIYYTQYFGRSDVCPYESTFETGLTMTGQCSNLESFELETLKEDQR